MAQKGTDMSGLELASDSQEVPDPGIWSDLLVGLIGLGGLSRQRQRDPAATRRL
jgi:hypothetical protein